jgi:putative ABC transport system ATP-binding protein
MLAAPQELHAAPAAAPPPVVRLDGVRFRWRRRGPEILVLEDVAVGRGERLFIEGPSGSGKSTLLGLLAGVTVAQAGSVQVLGQALEGLSGAARDRFRADHIGYIFQQFNLIPYLGIVDNVLLPCRFSALRRERALARSPDLRAEAKRLLGHLDLADPELLREPVTSLSVGQQQRVAAARALMGAPELVIADEPTSSLDADRRRTFVQLLFDECAMRGATLVFVSHDASLEPLFDRTLKLAEANRQLWGLIGIAENALLIVSVFVVVVGLFGMLTALLTSLNERRREMAILRSVGARPAHVFSLIMGEAGFLTLLGVVTGLALLYGLLFFAQPIIEGRFGLFIAISWLSTYELKLLGAVIAAGFLVGSIPSYRAYRLSLADGLSLRV